MMSRTGVLSDFPAATARTTMSRSVIIPTSRSSSPTGQAPAIELCHQARRITDRLIRIGNLDAAAHGFLTCIEFSCLAFFDGS